ncbi:MAG TPA: ABC transporter substrate-binding protein [Verrucomicrobiae bacterium]|nr:ABC transporter substrate-binding protein [Verrucomicrobiae bacterium]
MRFRTWDSRFWMGLLLLFAASLVGCEKRAESTEGVVVLNVLMEPDTTGIWRKLFAEFHERNPGIQIHHVEGPTATDAREDLYTTSFLSGESAYDLVYADVVWIPKFAAAGWLEDLTDRWSPSEWDRFISGSIEGSKYRGRIYRVPTQIDGAVLFYRKDLLAKAGERPPATFDDLAQISQKLQHPPQLWGFVWQGKQYEGLACDFLEVLIGYGGFWINPDTDQVGLDQPAGVAALTFLTDCVQKWKISPPGVTTYAEEQSRQLFQSGRAIFLRNWPYVWPLSQREESPIKGKVGLAPMPKSDDGRPASTLGGYGFAIAKSSHHQDAAWKFCEFISALPQIRRINQATAIQPALKSFYENSPDPVQQAIYRVLQTTVPRPPVPQYAQASDILQRYVSAALTGRLTPKQAMRGAASETRLLLRRTRTSKGRDSHAFPMAQLR